MSLSDDFKDVYRKYVNLVQELFPSPGGFYPVTVPPVRIAKGISKDIIDPNLRYVFHSDGALGGRALAAGSYFTDGKIFDPKGEYVTDLPASLTIGEWNNANLRVVFPNTKQRGFLIPVGSVIFSRRYAAMKTERGKWRFDGSAKTEWLYKRQRHRTTIEGCVLDGDGKKFGKIYGGILPKLISPATSEGDKIRGFQRSLGYGESSGFHPVFFPNGTERPRFSMPSGTIFETREYSHESIMGSRPDAVVSVSDFELSLEEYV